MTNKIEISRSLAERLTRYYPAEITGQETMQAIRIEALAALDELRAILAAPAVERKSVAVVGMLIDGVVHYFKDEHLVSESGAIVPEADELYRKSSAVERQEPVGFRYRANGDWELMEESPFADGRISHKEGGEELQPLYTYQPAPAVERQEPAAWIDGAPSGPWASEWFIAITTHGERVVLRQLPEDYTYDFTTADATYIMRDRIKKWMQFPDSDFVPFSPPAPVADGTTSDKYRAELYDEVWQKARDMGFNNVTDALAKLSAPVAVVLPDRRVQPNGFTGKGWAELRGWNSCLDKVKEMNE